MNRFWYLQALTEARTMYFKNGTMMANTKATLPVRLGEDKKMKGGRWAIATLERLSPCVEKTSINDHQLVC